MTTISVETRLSNALKAQFTPSTMAYTIIQRRPLDKKCPKYPHGLATLGQYDHLVVQIHPDGTPMARLYRSNWREDHEFPQIGGKAAHENTCAFDLTGQRGIPLHFNDKALVVAICRCLETLACESGGQASVGNSFIESREVEIPTFWAVYPKEALELARGSDALDNYASGLVANNTVLDCIVSTIDGEITHVEEIPREIGEPIYGRMFIQGPDGTTVSMMVPLEYQVVSTTVVAGKPFIAMAPTIPEAVAAEVAWFNLQAGAPKDGLPDGLAAIPIEYAAGLVANGVDPDYVLEDSRHMLAHRFNPAAQLRATLRIRGMFAEQPMAMKQRIWDGFKQLLGDDYDQASSTADLIQAFDNPARPLLLRTQIKVQCWPVSSVDDLLLRRRNWAIDCHFGDLRHGWRQVFGPTDPMLRPCTLDDELEILAMAVNAARKAREEHKNVYEAACDVLLSATRTDCFSELLMMLQKTTREDSAIECIESYRAYRATA